MTAPAWPGPIKDYRDVHDLFPGADLVSMAVPREPSVAAVAGLIGVLLAAPSPAVAREWVRAPEDVFSRVNSIEFRAFCEYVAAEAEIPVAESPLDGKQLVSLFASGTGAGGLVILAGLSPFIAIPVGAGVLVVGALWEGARPEVVSFGGDASATLLNKLRRRLGIERRQAPGDPGKP